KAAAEVRDHIWSYISIPHSPIEGITSFVRREKQVLFQFHTVRVKENKPITSGTGQNDFNSTQSD
ncbi:hypothetical protein K3G63_22655, partial [Hymenobacter sp. HSC-4F20]|uniref:hypothetical protein n=1 Tax=Hymenobacter sp. HSC-4F20 TaxID=2864135 RepID=UPI001C73AE6F